MTAGHAMNTAARPATDTDVLVVGAGPTGLMLANQLARRGVRTTIIDRHAGPARETRALGVQARTMEIYAKLGVVERAFELGICATGANIWGNGRKSARLPLGDAGRQLTPYPYIFILGQDDNERILGDRLRDWNTAVQWNTELVALAQHDDRVVATLKAAEGTTREITAAWIGGCDGARSAVRELSGIGFPGAPYEHVFFVADVQVTGDMVPDEVNVYLWRSGFHLFFPMRGTAHWRIVGILPADLRGRPDTDPVKFDDVVPSLHAEAGSRLAFAGCTWFSTYRIHHRAAERFRDRRCFLLGDAAHIHSPVGAQGMNTGLQDAYNLAWKMALVVQGRSDAALLDSYEAERIPVARRLLASTDRAFRLIVADNWLAGFARAQVIARIAAFAMSRPRIQQFVFRTVSQIGIAYRESPLSESLAGLPAAAPGAGDRFPWLRLKSSPGGDAEDLYAAFDDTRLTLLVIGQAPPADLQSGPLSPLHIKLILVDPYNDGELSRAGIPQPSFWLLRPDGYIGFCGVRPDAAQIARYLAERIRLTSEAM